MRQRVTTDRTEDAASRSGGAAIAVGYGCAGVTVRSEDDLDAVRKWLDGPRDRPMLVDAKVRTDEASWWLVEAFRGH